MPVDPNIYLTPISTDQPAERPPAERERMDAELVYKRTDQVRLEHEHSPPPETAGSVDAYGDSLSMNLALKNAGKTKTGDLRSTFHSNNGLHNYRGPILGMRQRIVLRAAEKGDPLPAGFENASAAMVVGVFRGMTRAGYFTGAETPAREAWTDRARANSITARQRAAQLRRYGFTGPRPTTDPDPQAVYAAIHRVIRTAPPKGEA